MNLKRWIPYLVIAGFSVAYPFIIHSYYFIALLTQILIIATLTMALNLLMGYTGLVSFGHGALFGAGAYAAGLLATHALQHNLWLGLTAGMFTASFIAAIWSLISLRTPGVYFIFITAALGQMVWAIIWRWRSLTGGDDGLVGIGNPVLWSSFSLSRGTSCYYLALILFALVFFAIYRLIRSPFGHALVGIRENEPRMKILGYDVWCYKLVAFIVSGAMSGLAGAVWAYYQQFLSPKDAGFGLSADVCLAAILGGSGTLVGPVVGTAVLVIIKNFIGAFTKRWLFILGVAYIVSVLFARRGIVGALSDRLKRWGGEA